MKTSNIFEGIHVCIFRSNPEDKDSKDAIYLCGNSLGLQPKQLESYLKTELDAWRTIGVEGILRFASFLDY